MKNQFEWGNQCGTNLNRKNHQKEMNFLDYRGGVGRQKGGSQFFPKKLFEGSELEGCYEFSKIPALIKHYKRMFVMKQFLRKRFSLHLDFFLSGLIGFALAL